MSKIDKVVFIAAIVSAVAAPVSYPAGLVTCFCLGWLIKPLLLDGRA